jgi:hypothetical protein
MKKKLVLGLIAILAIGLMFVGCPHGGEPTPPPPPPPAGFDDLTPLTPDPIPVPNEDYIGFPGEELLENYTSFAGGQGGQAEIEDNGDGTYKVTIKTTPGGVSFLSLNGAGYLFMNGFYLSLDLPETTEHKPIAAWAAPSKVPGDSGVYWAAQQSVNMAGPAVADTSKYLAGQVDFAWENLEYDVWPFKSIVLEFYWHEDDTVGLYEFTIKKILIHDGDDIVPPAYPTTAAHQTTPPAEPTGWTDILASTVITTVPANSTVTPGVGVQNVKVKTRLDGGANSRIYLSHSNNIRGYYVLLGLPEDPPARPVEAMAFLSSVGENNANWDSEYSFAAGKGKYAAGDVALYWEADEGSDWNYVNLYLYWHLEEEDGADYSFTIKKLLVLEDGSEAADPLEGWTDFPVDATVVSFDPLGGTIIDNLDGTYTVTAPTCERVSEWSHTEIILKGVDFAFKGGYYLSLTLPEQEEDSTMKPVRIYTNARIGISDNWDSGVDYDKRTSPGEWWEGDLEFLYAHETLGRHDAIVLSIYWVDGATDGQDYEFTINSIKVAEEMTEAPPEVEIPEIDLVLSQLENATYEVDAVAAPLVVEVVSTPNSSEYTYEWWQDTSEDQSTWPAVNLGVSEASYTPPTETAGDFYYYCVVKYLDQKTLTRVIKITVEEP